MDESLRKLVGRYPERELEVLRLYRNDPVFRSICEEMEMAVAAEARWKHMPERALEYRQIVDRLEDEFLEYASRHRR